MLESCNWRLRCTSYDRGLVSLITVDSCASTRGLCSRFVSMPSHARLAVVVVVATLCSYQFLLGWQPPSSTQHVDHRAPKDVKIPGAVDTATVRHVPRNLGWLHLQLFPSCSRARPEFARACAYLCSAGYCSYVRPCAKDHPTTQDFCL